VKSNQVTVQINEIRNNKHHEDGRHEEAKDRQDEEAGQEEQED
jgi:hypothetical protein